MVTDASGRVPVTRSEMVAGTMAQAPRSGVAKTSATPRMRADPITLTPTPSLPLNGGGRLRRDVEHHAVDAPHLVDDPRAYAREEIMGQPRPIGGHPVDGL